MELGAGRAVLGRVVSSITGAPLIAVDRRVPKEARVDDDDDWDEHRERHRPTLPDATSDDDDDDDDDGKETEDPSSAVVQDIASSSDTRAFAGHARRLVADLTGCSFASLAERANIAEVSSGTTTLIAKHLCAGATDAAVRLAIEGATDAAVLPGDPTVGYPRVVGVALAPCCHPQIKYAEYAGRDWLERRWREHSPGGRGLGSDGFATLLALLAFAKERVGASDETLMRYHGGALGDVANVDGGARDCGGSGGRRGGPSSKVARRRSGPRRDSGTRACASTWTRR